MDRQPSAEEWAAWDAVKSQVLSHSASFTKAEQAVFDGEADAKSVRDAEVAYDSSVRQFWRQTDMLARSYGPEVYQQASERVASESMIDSGFEDFGPFDDSTAEQMHLCAALHSAHQEATAERGLV